MTNTTPTLPDQILLRYGDDLYRLALLLAPSDRLAADATIAAVRRASQSSTLPDEAAVYGALVAALPPARSDRPPAWMLRAQARQADGPVLAALARLPRVQRLALALILLRGLPAEQAAPATGLEADQLRGVVRDALALLAPQIMPDLPQEHFDTSAAPEECEAARRALELNSPALHEDPAIRGHLALCPRCRAAEQSWEQITTRIEEVLRRTLREVVLPAEVFERAVAPPQPTLLARARALLAQTWLRRALVPVAVLALVGALVLPRAQSGTPTAGAPPAPPPTTDPRALVQRALGDLYAPPADGTGVWHGRWKIRWEFNSAVYAMLNAEAWRDPVGGRYRLQLVHEAGGGPYEFALSPSQQRAWYAATHLYADSIYPQVSSGESTQLDLRITPEQNRRMLEERLGSGAWGIAADYLRQALDAPDLRSWGRQRAENGDTLEVLSFLGTSPLGPPPDAPTAPPEPITLLLTINLHSGALYEVRELSGPAGSEQVGRTTWQFQGDEWIGDPIKANQQFELDNVWGGRGTFVRRDTLPSLALPLIHPRQIRPLALALSSPASWPQLPAQAPPDTTEALLFIRQTPLSHSDTFAVYTGGGRSLMISWFWQESGASGIPEGTPAEQIELNGQLVTLAPLSSRRYRAHLPMGPEPDAPFQIVDARGYTRAALIALLRDLRPLSLDTYQAQAPLFSDPREAEAEATAALQRALAFAPTSAEGSVRHVEGRVFLRRAGHQLQSSNPYEGPAFQGIPEETRFELWSRIRDGAEEIAVRTSALDGGEPLERSYVGGGRTWNYNRPLDQVRGYDSEGPVTAVPWEQTLVALLECGGLQLLSQTDGTAVVSRVIRDWRQPECQNARYDTLNQDETWALMGRGPYTIGLTEQSSTTRVFLDAEGRFVRWETRTGEASSGELIDAWTLERDERLTADQVAAELFDPEMPKALIDLRYDRTFREEDSLREIDAQQALEYVGSPLWVLPNADQPESGTHLHAIQAGTLPPWLSSSEEYRLQSPLDVALAQGFAVRFFYQFLNPSTGQMVASGQIYQGSDAQLGKYLRSAARWRNAASAEISVAGRPVQAWTLTDLNGEPWQIFTLDGTVVAMQGRSPAPAYAAEALQPLVAPVTP
ncbi:MAG TPA: hypothetical protein VFS21_27275 [Roseiflexaceae bacterium]|nr:hypothetical protein [Roseiflexaceae bacterium]